MYKLKFDSATCSNNFARAIRGTTELMVDINRNTINTTTESNTPVAKIVLSDAGNFVGFTFTKQASKDRKEYILNATKHLRSK